MAKPPTDNLERNVLDLIPKFEKTIEECERAILRNRIFLVRMVVVGLLSQADALSIGVTGPMLRATGIDYDVRKSYPYSVYDRVDFDVPVGHDGDNFDRFQCRMEEMRQSVRIVRQCIEQIPKSGPVSVSDVRVMLPEKPAVYNTIEGTIAHFKLFTVGYCGP
jgi:NADH-quinone oxidoreductase subunit D